MLHAASFAFDVIDFFACRLPHHALQYRVIRKRFVGRTTLLFLLAFFCNRQASPIKIKMESIFAPRGETQKIRYFEKSQVSRANMKPIKNQQEILVTFKTLVEKQGIPFISELLVHRYEVEKKNFKALNQPIKVKHGWPGGEIITPVTENDQKLLANLVVINPSHRDAYTRAFRLDQNHELGKEFTPDVDFYLKNEGAFQYLTVKPGSTRFISVIKPAGKDSCLYLNTVAQSDEVTALQTGKSEKAVEGELQVTYRARICRQASTLFKLVYKERIILLEATYRHQKTRFEVESRVDYLE